VVPERWRSGPPPGLDAHRGIIVVSGAVAVVNDVAPPIHDVRGDRDDCDEAACRCGQGWGQRAEWRSAH